MPRLSLHCEQYKLLSIIYKMTLILIKQMSKIIEQDNKQVRVFILFFILVNSGFDQTST